MSILDKLPQDSFFKKEDFETFLPSKFTKNDEDILYERKSVQLRLLDLHEKIYPEIRKKRWNIDKHNVDAHIVSGIDISNPFIANSLRSIWLHYGKTEREIKKYQSYVENKSQETFINHIRLQVIIGNPEEEKFFVGVWLVIGKNDSSVWDRDNIQRKIMKDKQLTEQFYKMVTELGKEYFISISANDDIQCDKIGTIDEFKDIVKKDNKKEYFIIGKQFVPDSIEISEKNIVNTVMNSFSELYPIYDFVKHRLD